MRHRLIVAVSQIALLGLLLVVPARAQASAPLAQAQAAANQLEAQINTLDGQMKAADGRYTLAKQQLTQVQQAITVNKHQLVALQTTLASDQQALAEHVVAMYEMPPAGVLDVVFSTRSFSDLVSSLDFMSKIEQQGATLVSQVSAAKNALAKQQVTLTDERNQAARLVSQIAQQESQIVQATQTRQAMLSRAQAKVKLILQQMAAAAAAARAAAAAQAAAQQRQQAQAPAPASVSPAGNTSPSAASGGYTPQSWAQALLADCHLPTTGANLSAIVAWEMAEGGNWFNGARYNPLDTTLPEPGATDMNSVGVKAYTSWSEGLTATVATLENGLYGNILAALRAGNNAAAVATAVATSPWGTEAFSIP